MTARVLHLHVESDDAFFARVGDALGQAQAGAEASGEHLSYSDLDTFLRSLSPKRMALAKALRSAGPSSIRALAAQVGRDYKSVHLDITKLIEAGLVERRDDRRVVMPYDRIIAEIPLDEPIVAAE